MSEYHVGTMPVAIELCQNTMPVAIELGQNTMSVAKELLNQELTYRHECRVKPIRNPVVSVPCLICRIARTFTSLARRGTYIELCQNTMLGPCRLL